MMSFPCEVIGSEGMVSRGQRRVGKSVVVVWYQTGASGPCCLPLVVHPLAAALAALEALREEEPSRLGNLMAEDLATQVHDAIVVREAPIELNTSVPSLRGQLLIAAPSLIDPNFARTVVLIGEHSEEGAMGVVLNRPSSLAVADAVPPLAPIVGTDDLVHVGGPVQPQVIVVLGEFETPSKASALVLDAIGFLPATVDEMEELGQLPRVRVFAGYAGWGPGQLEDELAEEAWIVTPALADDIFTAAPDLLWNAVLRRMGGPYAVLATMPADPSLN
jgi:putative transcriptional regulator